jgi:hypothetical protein
MGLPADVAGAARYCLWKAVVYKYTEKSGVSLAFRHKKPGENRWKLSKSYKTSAGKQQQVPCHGNRILLILWLLGLFSGYTMGGIIHVLLVIALVVAVAQVIQGRGRS